MADEPGKGFTDEEEAAVMALIKVGYSQDDAYGFFAYGPTSQELWERNNPPPNGKIEARKWAVETLLANREDFRDPEVRQLAERCANFVINGLPEEKPAVDMRGLFDKARADHPECFVDPAGWPARKSSR